MLSIYGSTSGNGVTDLTGLAAVATDTSSDGVSPMLASWLTVGALDNFNGLMTFPTGVTSAPQTSEANVINYVAGTTNSTGFVVGPSWRTARNTWLVQ